MTEPLEILLMGGVETRFHRYEEVTPPFAAVVRGAGHRCTTLPAPQALREDVLREFDVLSSITTRGALDEEQQAALLGAIAEPRNYRGRPLPFLGIHGATCSFTDNEAYYQMLGGRFLRHPPMCEFRVDVDATDHPLTRGMHSFDIFDECYEIELCADVQVLLSAKLPEETGRGSKRVPLGWVKRYGRGKVCYLALGHGPEQIGHPAVSGFVERALGWLVSDD